MKRNLKPKPEAGSMTEKTFVNLQDTSTSEATKTKLLYAIVGVFAVVLAVVWLNTLKNSFQGQSDALGFGRLTSDIMEGLSKYDDNKAEATATNTQPIINLTAINDSVEGDIAAQTSTAGWLDKSYQNLGVTLKYPRQWLIGSAGDKITLKPANNSSTTALVIEPQTNPDKLPLSAWLEKESPKLGGYQKPASPQAAATSQTVMKYTRITPSSTADAIYFLNASGSTKIIKVSAFKTAGMGALESLIDRIVANIILTK